MRSQPAPQVARVPHQVQQAVGGERLPHDRTQLQWGFCIGALAVSRDSPAARALLEGHTTRGD